MPTVNVPLQPYSDFQKLARDKRFAELATEKITLKQQMEKIQKRLDGDDEHLGLSDELYLLMDKYLPEDTKSVEFEGYMITRIDPGTSSKFSKSDLMKRPLRCTGCNECKRKKVALFVTTVDIEACTTEGTRKPTVSAEKINKDKDKSKDSSKNSGRKG